MKMLLFTATALALVFQTQAHSYYPYPNLNKCAVDADCTNGQKCKIYPTPTYTYYVPRYPRTRPSECVECLLNSDCASTNRLCSQIRNVCYCRDDNCPTGTVCNFSPAYVNGLGQPVSAHLDTAARCSIECRNDSHCPTGQVCNTANNTCVQCTEDADCISLGQVCNETTKLCVQCTASSECDASQSCNLTNMTCECDDTKCTTVLGAGNGKCTEAGDVQDLCVKICNAAAVGDYDYTGTMPCETNEVCLNDGTNNICRQNLIQCADDDGSNRSSARCPTGMSCPASGDKNSIYCAPACSAATSFCVGYECPTDFPFNLGGSPCGRNAENNGDICSCIKA